jgi:hypothetical protein
VLAGGSPEVIGFLRANAGQPWLATPTGPSGTLYLADAASGLGALQTTHD